MSQNEWILKTAKRKWVTPLDAYLGCGCLRLAARILELKKDGHLVTKKTIHSNGKHFAAYKVMEKRNATVRQH
jgi:hypothetical protein